MKFIALLTKASQQYRCLVVFDEPLRYFLDNLRDAVFRIIQAALRCRPAFEGIPAPPLQFLLVCLHISLDHAGIGKSHTQAVDDLFFDPVDIEPSAVIACAGFSVGAALDAVAASIRANDHHSSAARATAQQAGKQSF